MSPLGRGFMTVRRYRGTEMLVAIVHARNSFRMRIYETRTGVNFFFY